MFIVKSEGLLRDLILMEQRSSEHGGIVAIQGDHQALIEIVAHGMIGQGLTRPGAEIAGDANLDRDLTPGEFFDQFRVLRSGQAMPDALSMKVERAPNRVGPDSFSGMGGEA